MKYKAAIVNLNVDDANLQPKHGYWVWPKATGTLTLPDIGGTLSGATYAWNKLRFHNGTDELNITDADSEGWITPTGDAETQVIWYQDLSPFGIPRWRQIPHHKSTFSPWEGHFIWSNYDNITLIRQN